uniref:Uncharacterized protein n=1 Tax=Arundo donax TaxID=35708 RepID=A0A0A8ZPG2_ARUDO
MLPCCISINLNTKNIICYSIIICSKRKHRTLCHFQSNGFYDFVYKSRLLVVTMTVLHSKHH